MFGRKWGEVAGKWRSLQNEEVCVINGWECSMYGGGRGAYKVLVRRPDGKRPLGRPRRRWKDNIKMNL